MAATSKPNTIAISIFTKHQPKGAVSRSASGLFNRRSHLGDQLPLVDAHPAVALARAVKDLTVVRRVGFRQERFQQVDRVVQEVIVSFAYPDVNLAAQLGPSVFQFCSITSRRSYFFQCSTASRLIRPVFGSHRGTGRLSAPRGP